MGIACGRTFSQSVNRAHVNEIFEAVYDFRLNAADSLIKTYEKSMPKHPVWPLLSANVLWWKILTGYEDDKVVNMAFLRQLELTKAAITATNIDENEADFLLMIANAFRTRYDLLHGNYFTAAGYLNSCIDDISDSFGKEPLYEPFYLTSGLYYYFMQKGYEDYPLMRPYLFFFPDGDKALGLTYLNKCLNSEDVFLRNEAAYFLMRIYYDLEKNYLKAEYYNKILISSARDNVLFALFTVEIDRKLGRNTDGSEARFKAIVSTNSEFDYNRKSYLLNLLEEGMKE